jgi:catechol 2,3-dioxygenase-like lactoylglutathione lyase family enzyme
MIGSLDHIAVPMQAVEKMLAFYASFGCSIREDYPGYIYSVVFGDNKINFHTPKAWQSERFDRRAHTALPGSGDFCVVWVGSESALTELLAKLGAVVEEGPVERIGGRGGGQNLGSSIYTRDPDMNLVEFIMYSSNA